MQKLILCATLLAIPAVAQTSEATAAKDPIASDMRKAYTLSKRNITRAAEKMPEENYSFQPTSDVRTFGQLIGHLTNTQYTFCGAASGKQGPKINFEKEKTTKGDLVAGLKDAFAFCDQTFDALTDATLGETIKAFGGQTGRAYLLTLEIAHNMEHYGNIVTYMRLKGLVPPSSEPPPAKK